MAALLFMGNGRKIAVNRWWLNSGGAAAPIQLVSNPVIQGNAWEEGLLYVTDGAWKGRPYIFTYQWQRGGVDISGATLQKYTPQNADVGEEITCIVTASDGINSASYTATAPAIVDMYPTKVMSYSPFAYFRLNETSGTVADNYEGTSSRDGVYRGVGWKLAQCLTPDGFSCPQKVTAKAGNIDVYAAMNSAFNGNVGSIVCWVRSNTADDWNSAFAMLAYVYANNNNRILISRNAGVISFRRFGGGSDKLITLDYSVTKPTGWQCFAMTWDTSAGTGGELKAYANGVQVGPTLNNIGTFTGSLLSTSCTISANSTSSTAPWTEARYSDFAYFNTALSSVAIADLAVRPTGKYWYHSIEKTYDINALFSVTGRCFARFYYDVDNDGEWELIVSLGGQARWAAIKYDNTIVWDVTYDANVLDTARHPFIKNGILYQTHGTTLYAIRLSDGTKLWSTANVPNNDLRGGNDYIVCQNLNQLRLYNYNDGTEANAVVLPYATGTQTLSFGDIDGDGLDEYFTNDYHGRIMARDHDLSELFTQQYDQIHIDYMVVIGVDKLVSVIDTDASTVNEGDEVVIFDRNGNIVHSYQSDAEQVRYRVLPDAINGVKIVGRGIGSNTQAWGLDEDLNEVFRADGVYARNDFARIAGDVMLFNPNTENIALSAELQVIDVRNQKTFRFYHVDSGIELDDESSVNIDAGFVLGGGDANHEFVTPYILREVLIGDINTLSTGNEILRKHQWTLEDIP